MGILSFLSPQRSTLGSAYSAFLISGSLFSQQWSCSPYPGYPGETKQETDMGMWQEVLVLCCELRLYSPSFWYREVLMHCPQSPSSSCYAEGACPQVSGMFFPSAGANPTPAGAEEVEPFREKPTLPRALGWKVRLALMHIAFWPGHCPPGCWLESRPQLSVPLF